METAPFRNIIKRPYTGSKCNKQLIRSFSGILYLSVRSFGQILGRVWGLIVSEQIVYVFLHLSFICFINQNNSSSISDLNYDEKPHQMSPSSKFTSMARFFYIFFHVFLRWSNILQTYFFDIFVEIKRFGATDYLQRLGILEMCLINNSFSTFFILFTTNKILNFKN